MMTWPARHFERFHDWPSLRARRGEGLCVCGLTVDEQFVDDFDESVWCSRECFLDVALRCGLIKPTEVVYGRDRGICALCGVDAGLAARVIRHIRGHDRWDFRLSYTDNIARTSDARSAAFELMEAWGASEDRAALWEADHVIPVAEGGGGCGLDNYRTLCIACHRGETAGLATRRAERRLMANPTAPLKRARRPRKARPA
jgi:5-methylcytosine-specific restriction protein A